ncbi:MAG: GDSL family lipase [Proteobacteria bacterium]|nr:GDSL family lipase [Pseudomonadota bacterium]MBU1716582.1 GDSL family lipase [Pseudomonadota bacterium]
MADKSYSKLLFVGDSLIEFYDWQARFPEYQVDNKGKAGESVAELLWRTEEMISSLTPPDWILIMIGTNNVTMEDYGLEDTYEKVVQVYRAAFPQAKIVVNSLLPMRLPYLADNAVVDLNKRLQEMAARLGISFLDAYDKLTDDQGQPLASVLEDEIHLAADGYRLWADAVAEFL